MASNLRSETSKINGAKSHGPKSAETRAISSLNALKHGFTAHNTTLLACENPDEFQSLLDDYVTTYRPASGMEKRLVAEAAAAHWRILRLRTIETSLMDLEMIRQEPELEKMLTRFDVGIQLAVAFQALADESRAISLISRYESRLHRVRERMLNALLALRRVATPAEPIHLVPPTQPIRESEINVGQTNPEPAGEPLLDPSK